MRRSNDELRALRDYFAVQSSAEAREATWVIDELLLRREESGVSGKTPNHHVFSDICRMVQAEDYEPRQADIDWLIGACNELWNDLDDVDAENRELDEKIEQALAEVREYSEKGPSASRGACAAVLAERDVLRERVRRVQESLREEIQRSTRLADELRRARDGAD